MRIIDIQIKLNMNYNQAKRFKEQAELLGLLNVGGSAMTPEEIYSELEYRLGVIQSETDNDTRRLMVANLLTGIV